MKKSVDRKTKNRAKHLRKNASPVERLFWCRIRAGQLHGLRIRRQHPIGPYIADFYVPRLGLVIELDGDSHDFRVKKDRVRDRYMEAQKFFPFWRSQNLLPQDGGGWEGVEGKDLGLSRALV